MAYSDYGAYIWKNGEFLKDSSLDIYDSFRIFNKDHWTCNLDEEDISAKDVLMNEGHAILDFGRVCVAFYKNYGMKYIEVEDSGAIITKYFHLDSDKYYFDEMFRDIKFDMFYLDNSNSIVECELTYKDDTYFIIVGSSVGMGFDNRHISKFLKKSILYKEDSATYVFDTTKYHDVDYNILVEYMIRKDDVDFERMITRRYYIKPFIIRLFTFKWKYLLDDLIEIRKHLATIKYMK